MTRPEEQARDLSAMIVSCGGEGIVFPAIAIESTDSIGSNENFDWMIFVSANAVKFGLSRVQRTGSTRIAAIGKSTAAALESLDVRVDAVPDKDFTSEALLAHPALSGISGGKILLVKGAGGRELLCDELTQRGARVSNLEVYRRIRPSPDAASVQRLEAKWREGGIDIVTLTSVETVENFIEMLTTTGRSLAASTPFVTPSDRVAAAAKAKGFLGAHIAARGADDASIVGAIAAWHARAR